MSKTKRLLAMILTLATVFALFAGITVFADEEDAATLPAPAPDTAPVGSFTDVNWSSPYAEAIAVLAAAKITTGTTETTFGPSDNVTREQVAAFIARAKLSSAKAEQLLPADSGFSDVAKGDFFSKYIAFCVSENAINGKGDGTYDPKGNVTGVEVLKILEGVLNVDKVTELTGPLWETNTISYAIKLGLLDGVNVEDYGAPATREQIAQYILNALTAYGYTDQQSLLGASITLPGTYVQGAAPLYAANNLSRRQTEDTSKFDDGTFDPAKTFTKVTPYGELYYRWETATNGRGITSWKHDDKNEKIVETVVANPTTTGGLPSANLDVFKVYINGAVVSAIGAGTGSASDVTGVTVGRYVTNEYTFNPVLASAAFGYVAGSPNGYLQVTDETWTGATIKIYEQRLSAAGVYDPVTGRYNGTGEEWQTRAFDGKADKIIVTYDYLAEVAFKSTANGVTSYEVDLFDATGAALGNAASGRSRNIVSFTAKNVFGDYAVDDILRVTPVLPQTGAVGGAYMGWFTQNPITGDYITANSFNYYSAFAGISLLEHAKADTKQVTPTNYGYAWATQGSTQTSDRQGLYISETSGSELTWISGTYQEILRAERNELYADGSRYTVYLDKNGYILGGFSQAGAEYTFLTSALTNENSLTSTWRWLSTNDSEPRSMTYYPGVNTTTAGAAPVLLTNAFKQLTNNTTLSKNDWTTSERDVNNGVLRSGVTINGDAAYVYVGDVVRVWNNHAKILQGEVINAGNSLPSDGKLYVEAIWNSGTGSFAFTKRSAADANTNYRRSANAANATVYRYTDSENYIADDKDVVYVISYATVDFGIAHNFVAPRTGIAVPPAPPSADVELFGSPIDIPAAAAVKAKFTLTVGGTGFTGLSNTVALDLLGPAGTTLGGTLPLTFAVGFSDIPGVNDVVLDATYNTPADQATLIANYLATALTAQWNVTRTGATITLEEKTAAAPTTNAAFTVSVTGADDILMGSVVNTSAAQVTNATRTYNMAALPRLLVPGDQITLSYYDQSAARTTTAVYVVGSNVSIITLNIDAQRSALLAVIRAKIAALATDNNTAIPTTPPATAGSWHLQNGSGTNVGGWSVNPASPNSTGLRNSTTADQLDTITVTLKAN